MMTNHQRKMFDEIRERWAGSDTDRLTLIRAALDIGVLSGIVMAMEADTGVTLAVRDQLNHGVNMKPAVCRRGTLTLDPKTGGPFQHEIDKNLGYCVWCGLGAPPPKEDPKANLLANGGKDRVWCEEHGCFHEFDVSPEGKILNPPDCELFDSTKKIEEAPL